MRKLSQDQRDISPQNNLDTRHFAGKVEENCVTFFMPSEKYLQLNSEQFTEPLFLRHDFSYPIIVVRKEKKKKIK